MHLATYTITPCSNYHATVIDSLFALICNISDTDFSYNAVRCAISSLGVLDVSSPIVIFVSIGKITIKGLIYRTCLPYSIDNLNKKERKEYKKKKSGKEMKLNK